MAMRNGNGQFGWGDLPVDPARETALFDALARSLRLAAYWKHAVEPWLNKREEGFLNKLLSKSPPYVVPWMNKQCGDVDWEASQDLREDLNGYFDALLTWATTIERYAETLRLRFGLWATQDVVTSFDEAEPANPVTLKPVQPPATHSRIVESIVLPRGGDSLRGGPAVLEDLMTPLTGNHRGLGRVVAAVHNAVRPF
jgi:hypothetical protein